MLENTLAIFHTSKKTVSASTKAVTHKPDPSENRVYSILQMRNISKANSCLQQGSAMSLRTGEEDSLGEANPSQGRMSKAAEQCTPTWTHL